MIVALKYFSHWVERFNLVRTEDWTGLLEQLKTEYPVTIEASPRRVLLVQLTDRDLVEDNEFMETVEAWEVVEADLPTLNELK